MKLRGWASLLLAAVVGLSGQRADASYARLDTGLPAIESSLLQAPSPAVTEIPADAWLVESIIPLGTTADGQPLALISFLVPLSSLDEIAPASTRAGPYAAPETHTRVFCIVQPPLGLEIDVGLRVGLRSVWTSFKDAFSFDGFEIVATGRSRLGEDGYISLDVGYRSYREGLGASSLVAGPFSDTWISLTGTYAPDQSADGKHVPMLTASPAHISALPDKSEISYSHGQTLNWHSHMNRTRVGHIQIRAGDWFVHYANDSAKPPSFGGTTDYSHSASANFGKAIDDNLFLIYGWSAFTGMPQYNPAGTYRLQDHDHKAKHGYHLQTAFHESFNRSEHQLSLGGHWGIFTIAEPVMPPSSFLNWQNLIHESPLSSEPRFVYPEKDAVHIRLSIWGGLQ